MCRLMCIWFVDSLCSREGSCSGSSSWTQGVRGWRLFTSSTNLNPEIWGVTCFSHPNREPWAFIRCRTTHATKIPKLWYSRLSLFWPCWQKLNCVYRKAITRGCSSRVTGRNWNSLSGRLFQVQYFTRQSPSTYWLRQRTVPWCNQINFLYHLSVSRLALWW
jgi:hypothetical protein